MQNHNHHQDDDPPNSVYLILIGYLVIKTCIQWYIIYLIVGFILKMLDLDFLVF